MSKIKEALKKLDTTNDNHWTVDGLPRIDTVKMLAADQSITREVLDAEVPGFNRDMAKAGNYGETQANTSSNGHGEVKPESGDTKGSNILDPNFKGDAPKEVDGNPEEKLPQIRNDNGNAVNVDAEGKRDGAIPAIIDEASGGVVTMATIVAHQQEQGETPKAPESSASFEDRRKQAEDEVNKAVQAVEQAKDNLTKRQGELDEILMSADDEGKESNAEAIQGYLAAQRDKLEERGAKGSALRQAGITPKDLKDLLPQKSPLDQSMVRNKNRPRPGTSK